MKVAFVVGGLPFGGIENLLFDISRELKRRDVKFTIINLSGTGQKVSEFLENNIPMVNLNQSLKSIKTYRLDTALKLRKLLRELSPQVIHSMHFSADYFSRLASPLLDTKVVTHIHSTKKEKRIERRFFNKLLSYKTDVFLSVSKEVYKVVEKQHNIFSRPHYILYNGIDFKKISSEKHTETNNSEKSLICIGRLVKEKNFDIAIKTLHLLKDEFPQLKLIIVGEGKERGKLESLATQLGLSERVIFTGYRKNVFEIIQKAHVFLLPSDYEGFAIAHLEAMYMGLPAVISPFVPSREIASECSIISPIEPKEMAKAVRKLLTDKLLYQKYSQKAKEIARKFSIENYVDKLLSLYDGVLTGNLPDRKIL